MNDFNPATLFFILHESMGAWLWLLLGLAILLLAGIIASAVKLVRAGAPMTRPLAAALIAGLVVAVAVSFAVPAWTMADLGALGAAVDYVFAFLLALVPGAIVAAGVFMLAARRCVKRQAAGA